MLHECVVVLYQVVGKIEQLLAYPVRAQTVSDKTKVCNSALHPFSSTEC